MCKQLQCQTEGRRYLLRNSAILQHYASAPAISSCREYREGKQFCPEKAMKNPPENCRRQGQAEVIRTIRGIVPAGGDT